jgi:hypothetical protein
MTARVSGPVGRNWDDSTGRGSVLGGIVHDTAESQRLSAFLMMFKNRTDRSYQALARRAGVSSSSLHRYCVGTCVPTDYGTVQRFARECGATQPELRELHRLWTLADARRKARAEVTVTIPAVVPRPVLVGVAVFLAMAVWRFVSGKQRQQV